MVKRDARTWYRAAKLFALAFVILSPVTFVLWLGSLPTIHGPADLQAERRADLTFILGLLALCFTGLGTISSVVLGWRTERRQAAESKLRIEQLEIQLAQARAETKISN